MLGFIWFIIMGGIIGWLASIIMRRGAAMGVPANILVRIVGSFIGNGLLSFITGGGTIGGWPPDWSGVISALIGSVILLGIVNKVQQGRLR
jgi:uncharacterized membrane protein YeaQ/YmgE (transglycosylase-associated protein family)